MYRIKKSFEFSASHQLKNLSEEHPCARNHGHNYTVELTLEDQFLDDTGFLKDYRELDFVKIWLDEKLDHRNLNDILPFNPTAELIAQYLYLEFGRKLTQLVAVTVKETSKTSATYEPRRRN